MAGTVWSVVTAATRYATFIAACCYPIILIHKYYLQLFVMSKSADEQRFLFMLLRSEFGMLCCVQGLPHPAVP